MIIIFKKENLTSIIFIFVIVFFIGIIGVSKFVEKDETKPTIKTEQTMEGTFSIENQPTLGSKDAPNKIMVFFDYNCPHCKDWDKFVYPNVLKNLVNTNKASLSFVHLPVLGESSVYAAATSELVWKENPDQFWNFHEELIKGVASTYYTTDIAQKYLPTSSEEDLVDKISENNNVNQVLLDRSEAKRLGLTGTPSIVVNGKVAASPNYEDIVKLLKK